MASSEPDPKFHPEFDNVPGGDFILVAADGTHFRTYSLVLKLASAVWETMLSLPNSQEQIVHLDDAPEALANILRILTFKPIPRLTTLDEIEPLAVLADKYQMEGPLSIIRAFTSTECFLAEPLRAYRLAYALGWQDEAKAASTRTLSLDFGDPTHHSQLEKLGTKALLALMNLQWQRKKTIISLLDEIVPEIRCKYHGHHLYMGTGSGLDVDARILLLSAVSTHLNEDASGSTILHESFSNDPSLKLFQAGLVCLNCGEKRVLSTCVHDTLSMLIKTRAPDSVSFP